MMSGDRKRDWKILKLSRLCGTRLFMVGLFFLDVDTAQHLLEFRPILTEIMQQSRRPHRPGQHSRWWRSGDGILFCEFGNVS